MRQRTIPSDRVHEVNGEVIPRVVDGLTQGELIVDKFMENLPAIVSIPGSDAQENLSHHEEEIDIEFGNSSGELTRLSARHGRSFEVNGAGFPEHWLDSHGNIYGSVSIKGNNFSNPTLIETATAHEGIIAFGLQESLVIQRVLRASSVLRAAGVGTEYIMAASQPTQLLEVKNKSGVDFHEFHDLDKFKQIITHNYWSNLPEKERTPQKLGEILVKLQKMSFFITLRAMDTSCRLSEFAELPESQSQIFAIANRYLLQGNMKKFNEAAKGDDRNDELERLITEITIPRMAKHMARLHKKGLAHRFPNGQNMTALGSLIDLDSIHGETLGLEDKPITEHDVLIDLEMAGASLRITQKRLQELNYRKFHESSSFVSAFIRNYQHELTQLQSSTDSFEINLTKLASLANEERKQTSDSPFDDGEYSRHALEIICEVFSPDYNSLYGDQLRESYRSWLAENNSKLPDIIAGRLAEHIPTFIDIALNCFIESDDFSKCREAGFDVYQWTIDDGGNVGALQFLSDMICDLPISEFINQYDFAEQLGVASYEVTLLKDTVHDFLFQGRHRPGIICGDEIESLFFERYEAEIRAKLKVPQTESIIPPEFNIDESLLPLEGLPFVRETSDIELSELITICDSNPNIDINFSIGWPERLNGKRTHIIDTAYNLAQFEILEIITDDGYIDLADSMYVESDDMHIVSLHGRPKCSYIAVVKKTNDTKRSVEVFFFPPPSEKDEFMNMDDDELTEVVRSRAVSQEKLLDADEMYSLRRDSPSERELYEISKEHDKIKGSIVVELFSK